MIRRLDRVIRRGLMGAVVAGLAWGGPDVGADVWDLGSDADNDVGTDNEVTHGLDQVHDLAAQQGGTVEDVDFYRLQMPPYSSWEIVVDGATGDVGSPTGPTLDMVGPDGVSLVRAGVPLTGFGVAKHVTDQNFSLLSSFFHYVRVGGADCGLTCGANDQYRIRAFDTTMYLPRFNNANGQVTILVLQNNADVAMDGRAFAFDTTGALVTLINFVLPPFAVQTFNLATVNGGVLNNRGGALRIIHLYGGYGLLTGKAVALEPATGFTFDTALVPRP